jgi:hypothetical protein
MIKIRKSLLKNSLDIRNIFVSKRYIRELTLLYIFVNENIATIPEIKFINTNPKESFTINPAIIIVIRRINSASRASQNVRMTIGIIANGIRNKIFGSGKSITNLVKTMKERIVRIIKSVLRVTCSTSERKCERKR